MHPQRIEGKRSSMWRMTLSAASDGASVAYVRADADVDVPLGQGDDEAADLAGSSVDEVEPGDGFRRAVRRLLDSEEGWRGRRRS